MSEANQNRRAVAEHDFQRGGIRRGLRTTTSGTINENSADIRDFVAFYKDIDPELLNDLAHCCADQIEGPLPYGPTLFPHGLLEQFCGGDSPPVIPESPSEIDAAIERFWPDNQYAFANWRDGRWIREEQVEQRRENLRRALVALSAGGEATDSWTRAIRSLVGREIASWQWNKYTGAHSRQREAGGLYTLDMMSQVALDNFSFNENFGIFRHATGRFKSYLLSTYGIGDVSMPVLSRIRVPEGPYKMVAKKLLLTAAFTSIFDVEDSRLLGESINDRNQSLVQHNTTRATGFDAPELAASFVAGLREADEQAMLADVSMLMSSRVKGYDTNDGDRLVEHLIRDDMLDELAIHARQGLMACLALYGTFIPDLVAVKPDGRLEISSRGIDVLQALQEISYSIGAEVARKDQEAIAAYQRAHDAWVRARCVGEPPKEPRLSIRMFGACPYAGVNRTKDKVEPGAISQRGAALLDVYRCVKPEASGIVYPWERYSRSRPPLAKFMDIAAEGRFTARDRAIITRSIGWLTSSKVLPDPGLLPI